ncbi:LacI family DNA-binding transcriptional regulator [Micrococcales bacterium 31B]|nr:LacI family DNA-binding transcriptional regulator [Micrococcales bacterium 31B]
MVADLAGVSTATVSYVLSGRGDRKAATTDETARRVQAAVETLGYRRNEAARSMRTGASGFAVLSLTMLSDPWSLDLVAAARAAFLSSGVTPLILADADWRSFVGSHAPDVVFIDALPPESTARAEHIASLRSLARQGHKIVVVGGDLEPDGFDVVSTEAFPGCDDAMRYLLERHTRIGCITVTTDLASHGRRTRYSAYARALDAAGLPLDPRLVGHCELDATSAFAAAMQLLTQPQPPTALYATSDFMAVAALQAAAMLNLRVPEDVAILGVGNTNLSARLTPSLTSVGPENFFATVAQHLADRAHAASCGDGVRLSFEWRVIERDSTRPTTPKEHP